MFKECSKKPERMTCDLTRRWTRSRELSAILGFLAIPQPFHLPEVSGRRSISIWLTTNPCKLQQCSSFKVSMFIMFLCQCSSFLEFLFVNVQTLLNVQSYISKCQCSTFFEFLFVRFDFQIFEFCLAESQHSCLDIAFTIKPNQIIVKLGNMTIRKSEDVRNMTEGICGSVKKGS